MSVAIITGASSGIGKEFVKQMAQYPDITEFWLIARREDKLKELADDLNVDCKILAIDLSTEQGLFQYLEVLKNNKPNVKYVVNAAGYGKYGNYEVVDTKTAFNMIDLNVKALLFVTQETIPYIENGGYIIQIGSASTYNPLPNLNVYASTKSFIKHYSRALNFELKDKNISVTTICPGWVKTDFFARADIDTYSNKSFAKPMVNASDVVKKALKDAKKRKDISMYALFNNTHHLLAKILPHKLIINMWMKMQNK